MNEDRLRSLIDVLIAERRAEAEQLARRVYLSRFHFDRIVRAALRESPAAFRRRLLLERAAWEIASGDATVTDVALRAGYGSLEAFTRAFRRAYGVTASGFRSADRGDFRLDAPNGIHSHPPGGLLVPGPGNRRSEMDLTDRMLEHDLWLTRRLIDDAGNLPTGALDAPVELGAQSYAFALPATVRSMLNRLVWTKEMWNAAI